MNEGQEKSSSVFTAAQMIIEGYAVKKTFLLLITILYLLPVVFNHLKASDIPIIVIAPSKKAQSISTVGTSVTILDQKFFNN